jgi:triphosphatase
MECPPLELQNILGRSNALGNSIKTAQGLVVGSESRNKSFVNELIMDAMTSLPAQSHIRRATPKPRRSRIVPKTRALRIAAVSSLDDAMAALFADAYRHWQVNDTAARAGVNIEGVHQVRVALRRFRSGLSLLKKFIPTGQRKWLSDEARWLLAELGPVRDLDVLCAALPLAHLEDKVGPDAVSHTTQALQTTRRVAQARARVALESMRAQRLARRIEAWASGRGWLLTAGDATKDPRFIAVGTFALRALNRRVLKLLAFGKKIDSLPVPALHDVRIAVKKTRYGLDAFKSALPKRRATKLAAVLKTLQDRLGHLNDLDVATSILDDLRKTTRNTRIDADIDKTGSAIIAHHRLALSRALKALPGPWQALRKLGVL